MIDPIIEAILKHATFTEMLLILAMISLAWWGKSERAERQQAQRDLMALSISSIEANNKMTRAVEILTDRVTQ